MKPIEYKELIELFINKSLPKIKSEEEVPNINFKFDKETLSLLNTINKENTELLNKQDNNTITININDGYKFFKLLQEITNSLMKLRNYYKIKFNPKSTATSVMERIWLRMGINDINNVEQFLEKQLQFTNNMTFNNNYYKKVDSIYDYDIYMSTTVNETYDETTRSMLFLIIGNNNEYELPRILYDIDDNNNCYIYGVQSINLNKKDKEIERKLYKINKNIDNPNVHPNKVYAMLFFINELKKKNISKIIVPSMQVLNYHYHELLGKEAKKNLDKSFKELEEHPNERRYMDEYLIFKEWYDRVYQKQDKISYLKTEELFNLIYRLLEHDQSLEITNDINIQGDSLNLRINK